MKPSLATIVRVALLALALANMACATLGVVPEEVVGSSQAYEIGSYIVTAVMALINMWKNNSFTEAAIAADEYMKQYRAEAKGRDTEEE